MSAAALDADSDCIGSRVEIADESTCLMMTQSAAETPDTAEAAELTAEATAEAAELTAEAAELSAEAAEKAAELAVEAAEPELLELQAASTAQHPPTAITASARRACRRDSGLIAGLVTLSTTISFRPLPGLPQDIAGTHRRADSVGS